MDTTVKEPTSDSFKTKLIAFLKTNWGRFFLGILIIYLNGKVCKWLCTHDHLVIACFLAVITGIVGIAAVISISWGGWPMMLTIFLLIFSGMIPCFTARYGGNGDSAGLIDIKDAAKYTDETSFHFKEARVLKDYYGYEPVMGRRYKVGDAYVAPIVSADWDKSKPVTAWAAAEYDWPESIKYPLAGGYRVAWDDSYSEAVKDAEKRNGIRSAENAPILEWCANPEYQISRLKAIEFYIFTFFAMIWTLIFWIAEATKKEEDIKKDRKATVK